MREGIYCNFVVSPVGKIGVVFTDKEVLRIGLFVKERNFLKMVEKEFGCMVKIKRNSLFKDFSQEIKEYFEGKRKRFDIPVAIDSTDFQVKVWLCAMKIPYGKTITYGELAKKIKRPKTARAVGGAMKKNPIPLLIPCHRVIGVGGKLVGFQPSIKIKKFLLSLEGALPPPTSKNK